MEKVFDKRWHATVRDLLAVVVEFAPDMWTEPRVPVLMACLDIVAFVALKAVYEVLNGPSRVIVDITLHDIDQTVRTRCERNRDENARRVENID